MHYGMTIFNNYSVMTHMCHQIIIYPLEWLLGQFCDVTMGLHYA